MNKFRFGIIALGIAGLLLTGCDSANAPTTGPGGRPLTKVDSVDFVGDVTPTVYFRYMGWTGSLKLGPVNVTADRVEQLKGHAWIFLGIGSGDVSSNSQTIQSYLFSVTNAEGATLQVTLPKEKFIFHQQAGVEPYASFNWIDKKFFRKGDDNRSLFYPSEDPDYNGTDGGSASEEFANTAPATLIQRYAQSVDVFVTPAQYTQLFTPGLNAAAADAR